MSNLVERATNKVEFVLDRHRFRGHASHVAVRDHCRRRYGYVTADDPFDTTMRLLQIGEPDLRGFEREWAALTAELNCPGTGLDSDRLLASILYAIVRGKQPTLVVETGVARGISSRMILAAMEINQHGQLISIDLEDGDEAWKAVPETLRGRWRFLLGSSRRLLRDVLAGGIPDVFIHDSQHTYRNMRFELQAAWVVMRPGAILVADDIHENAAFAELAANEVTVIGQEEVKAGLFGVALK